MAQHAEIKDTPSLMVKAFRQLSQLMQDEVTLAKAELSRNLSRAGAGLALIGVAAILALTALDVLAGALVAYLATTEMSVGTAALIVGGGCLVVALVLAFVGKSRLTADALSPDRTMHNLSQDLDAMKEATDA
ncbi:phage holin family protein [uncultured Tateyamaria sp.]|uniref:phage holin family protein n=1 Tax=uncultured Tateyamaria sp. TaxID=455651 RepID=UPI00260261AD|nr:phage holin family protein [uncultured Tateyamaria sp.]